MFKNFRYILHSFAPNYLWEGFFALLISGLCFLSGASAGREGGFARMALLYFNLFPGILLVTMLLVGNAFTTSILDLALSYGARRDDYYGGLLLFSGFNTLVFWASDILFYFLPIWLGWQGAFDPPSFSPMFPALLMAALSLGCALGPFISGARWRGGLMGALGGGFIGGALGFSAFSNTVFWHDFGWVPFSLALLVTLLCQLKTRSIIVNATVR